MKSYTFTVFRNSQLSLLNSDRCNVEADACKQTEDMENWTPGAQWSVDSVVCNDGFQLHLKYQLRTLIVPCFPINLKTFKVRCMPLFAKNIWISFLFKWRLFKENYEEIQQDYQRCQVLVTSCSFTAGASALKRIITHLCNITHLCVGQIVLFTITCGLLAANQK